MSAEKPVAIGYLVVFFGLAVVGCILGIGQQRKPTTPAAALLNLVMLALAVVSIVVVGS